MPSIAVESPLPSPSPEPIPPVQSQEPTTPDFLSPNLPLTFPNLTPINLPTHSDARSSRDSASSDSAMTLSFSSSVITKDTNSLGSFESFSPEPAPLTKEISPQPVTLRDPPSPESPPPHEEASSNPIVIQDPPTPKPSPPCKEVFPESITKEDPPTPVKPVRFARSTSASEAASVPSSAAKSDESLMVPSPTKSRSLSTSATPTALDRTVFSYSPVKESNTSKWSVKESNTSKGSVKESNTPKVSAIEALASASSKISLMEADIVIQTPTTPTSKKNNSELTLPASKTPSSHNGLDVSAPPTPATSASAYSFGSGSATPSTPATPKDSSSGPSPVLTSRTSRGTPGLAERPSATVVRSGSLHEKPTTHPVIDEWERKLYGRNASE